ncbi:circadian period extender [Acaryochloris marina]|uniref:Circadian period extender, putative n=1 Tax=Acaryochloris marina (strain MBIC 11017) TaxID=329726 RepID=A8ZN61_ACAM1|nr:circadian period extender [Acaryochloris marina]ABW32260.1 circadian period extender, putative [Acaryochloris marina MBIC11017]
MKFQDIFEYFKNPPPTKLCQEVAACFILSVLIDLGDSDFTAISQYLKSKHPAYRVSDHILYIARNFLVDEALILSYWQKQPGQGRPNQMYKISVEKQGEALQLAQLWHRYLGE